MNDNTMRDKMRKHMMQREAEFGRPMTAIEAADGAVAALPDMIAPLVWVGSETMKLFLCGDYIVQNEYDMHGKSCWVFGFKGFHKSDHDTQSEAKAAANAHRRAAIMAAFGEGE